MTNTPVLRAIHHVVIICSDYQSSKRFYTEVLQLPFIDENYRSDRDSWKQPQIY